jgi:hypothetical protein
VCGLFCTRRLIVTEAHKHTDDKVNVLTVYGGKDPQQQPLPSRLLPQSSKGSCMQRVGKARGVAGMRA